MLNHTFLVRLIYPNGKEPAVELEDQCGFIVDEAINSTVFDVVHCNRPRSEHIKE